MDLNLDLSTVLNIDSEGFSIFQSNFSEKLKPKNLKIVNEILDLIGDLSSEVKYEIIQAQGLKGTITTAAKFFSSDHKLYLKIDYNSVIGLLKIGTKTLFINDGLGNFQKITPLCVLDFYVHQTQQRNGYGKVTTQLIKRNCLRKCLGQKIFVPTRSHLIDPLQN